MTLFIIFSTKPQTSRDYNPGQPLRAGASIALGGGPRLGWRPTVLPEQLAFSLHHNWDSRWQVRKLVFRGSLAWLISNQDRKLGDWGRSPLGSQPLPEEDLSQAR